MNARRFFTMLIMTIVCMGSVHAQSWLSRLKDKAVDKVKEKVEQKVEEEVGEATDDVLNGKSSKKGKAEVDSPSTEAAAEKTPEAVATHQKSDFKRGGTILFEDDFANEQVGESPQNGT